MIDSVNDQGCGVEDDLSLFLDKRNSNPGRWQSRFKKWIDYLQRQNHSASQSFNSSQESKQLSSAQIALGNRRDNHSKMLLGAFKSHDWLHDPPERKRAFLLNIFNANTQTQCSVFTKLKLIQRFTESGSPFGEILKGLVITMVDSPSSPMGASNASLICFCTPMMLEAGVKIDDNIRNIVWILRYASDCHGYEARSCYLLMHYVLSKIENEPSQENARMLEGLIDLYHRQIFSSIKDSIEKNNFVENRPHTSSNNENSEFLKKVSDELLGYRYEVNDYSTASKAKTYREVFREILLTQPFQSVKNRIDSDEIDSDDFKHRMEFNALTAKHIHDIVLASVNPTSESELEGAVGGVDLQSNVLSMNTSYDNKYAHLLEENAINTLISHCCKPDNFALVAMILRQYDFCPSSQQVADLLSLLQT